MLCCLEGLGVHGKSNKSVSKKSIEEGSHGERTTDYHVRQCSSIFVI